MIRGVACYAGHYPNEIATIKELANGAVDNIEWQFYVYFVSMLILAGLGMWVQIHRMRKED